jgi:hypothetical protein
VLPDLTVPTITITAWPDTVIDAVGHDPRSTYVEMFWLSILGPSRSSPVPEPGGHAQRRRGTFVAAPPRWMSCRRPSRSQVVDR